MNLVLVDEAVQRVVAAWSHARIRRAAAGDACTCCGWVFDRDRLARLAGVITRDLERALDVMDASRLIDETTGDVVAEAQAYVRGEIAARVRRELAARQRQPPRG